MLFRAAPQAAQEVEPAPVRGRPPCSDPAWPTVLTRIASVLTEVADVVLGRATEATAPAWSETRGWTTFLSGLSDTALADCERRGLNRCADDLPKMPPTLARFCSEVNQCLALIGACHPSSERSLLPQHYSRVPGRKKAQIGAVVGLSHELMQYSARVVDIGSGHGHLTRLLRASLHLDAVGIERNASLARTAQELAGPDGPRTLVADALTNMPRLRPGDFAVGLHACGDLSDELVRIAVDGRAPLLLISCCPQKTKSAERQPLSSCGERLALRWPREVLGLANLGACYGDDVARVRRAITARGTRFAVRVLLAQRGIHVSLGEASRGVGRRCFAKDFEVAAAHVCCARGLPLPSRRELDRVRAEGRIQFALVRRFSLPRAVLGRLMEMAIVLDRACALEERGYAVRVEEIFPAAATPRNLAIMGWPPRPS